MPDFGQRMPRTVLVWKQNGNLPLTVERDSSYDVRILLLTDNYLPESNAPALRCSMHARRWVERGHHVDVVTSFPNFPEGKVFAGYRQSLFKRESLEGVLQVLRVPTLIFRNSGVLRRILDFLSFMITGCVDRFSLAGPTFVIATSPQFFTAISGWLVSRIYRRPLCLNSTICGRTPSSPLLARCARGLP